MSNKNNKRSNETLTFTDQDMIDWYNEWKTPFMVKEVSDFKAQLDLEKADQKETRRKVFAKKLRKGCENLEDWYIKRAMCSQGFSKDLINEDLIKAKRGILILKRIIKNNKP